MVCLLAKAGANEKTNGGTSSWDRPRGVPVPRLHPVPSVGCVDVKFRFPSSRKIVDSLKADLNQISLGEGT
jgi:hypothetical protein